MTSTLGAQYMSRAELRALPTPEKMGKNHLPIPHIELVETMHKVLEDQGIEVAREGFAVQNTHTIFGTMDFAPTSKGLADIPASRGHAIGFRAANNQSRALEVATGGRIFVCDNLCFAPGLISMKRKHTVGLDLAGEIAGAVERYRVQATELESLIGRAQGKHLTPAAAKVLMFDAFVKHEILPHRLMASVSQTYFTPEEEWTDITEHANTLWALHNAFTRHMRELKPRRRFVETAKLGGLLKVDFN